ncbi:MAG: hypothetical protein KHW86_17360 [Porphyromonadaceae bacterium]|jgi:hypothetical protein|uniref:hypothetical protein n=1 Tax=Butyricimonas virosa TaxID=544645 RepID=UPI00307BA2F5|nr:hypothetical protein [Porphyromonadaceae bacterium]
MSKKRKNDIRRIITITPVEFKTVKREEEFVSMTAYEMLANAYKEAFDECTRLKAKLARIQELIKE